MNRLQIFRQVSAIYQREKLGLLIGLMLKAYLQHDENDLINFVIKLSFT